jgi:APA family basic amino acid/polyamine antiporter
LTGLGIGAVIGSGIFTLVGTAAAGENLAIIPPARAIAGRVAARRRRRGDHRAPRRRAGRFAVVPGGGAGLRLCGAVLCELASMIPVSGSAYSFAYATLGEIFAWVLGWDRILEYAVSNMAVAVGFSAY